MPFICRFCDAANPDEVQHCETCGAERRARLDSYVPGATLVLGLGLLILAALVFYNSYPPGTKVYIWSKTGGYLYSSTTSIALTTAIPAILGIVCVVVDIFKRLRS